MKNAHVEDCYSVGLPQNLPFEKEPIWSYLAFDHTRNIIYVPTTLIYLFPFILGVEIESYPKDLTTFWTINEMSKIKIGLIFDYEKRYLVIESIK